MNHGMQKMAAKKGQQNGKKKKRKKRKNKLIFGVCCFDLFCGAS